MTNTFNFQTRIDIRVVAGLLKAITEQGETLPRNWSSLFRSMIFILYRSLVKEEHQFDDTQQALDYLKALGFSIEQLQKGASAFEQLNLNSGSNVESLDIHELSKPVIQKSNTESDTSKISERAKEIAASMDS